MQKLIDLHKQIDLSINSINPVFHYSALAEKFIELCELIENLPDDNDNWYYIGDDCYENIVYNLVGAFWHYMQWHAGQNSIEYRAYCALNSIYTPNMETEPTSSDDEGFNTYTSLCELASEINLK
jgi:hypothetical protein